MHELDFAPLYNRLPLDDTNIEGAVVCGNELVLLQRGNNRHETSALVLCPRSPCEVGGVPRSGKRVTIIPVTLPNINGVPYGFTDGLRLPNGNILYAVTDADDPAIPAQLLLLEGWR